VRQVVADRNVFVSAIVYGGKALEVLEMDPGFLTEYLYAASRQSCG
jgi:hypothetical protein